MAANADNEDEDEDEDEGEAEDEVRQARGTARPPTHPPAPCSHPRAVLAPGGHWTSPRP